MFEGIWWYALLKRRDLLEKLCGKGGGKMTLVSVGGEIIAVTAILFGLLYLGSLVFDRDVSRAQYLLSTAFNLLLKLKFPKILKYKRTSVCYATKFPSSGLRFSVDCSLGVIGLWWCGWNINISWCFFFVVFCFNDSFILFALIPFTGGV